MKFKTSLAIATAGLGAAALWVVNSMAPSPGTPSTELTQARVPATSVPTPSVATPSVVVTQTEGPAAPVAVASAPVAATATPKETAPAAPQELTCKTFQFQVREKFKNTSAEAMGQYRHRIRTAFSGLASVDPATACLQVGKRTVKHQLTRSKDGAWEFTFGAVATAQSTVSLSVCRKNAKPQTPCKLSKNLAMSSLGLDENGESDSASQKGFHSNDGQDGMSAQVEREMTRELAGESEELAFFEGWEAVTQ